MNHSVNVFSSELTICLIDESGFKQSQCQIYINHKYTPDGYKLVVLCYVDECVYWYTYEEIGKCFVDTFEKI